MSAAAAGAKPAIEVDLASKTAWTFRPDGEGAQAKTLLVPAGGWRLNGFPYAKAGTYERQITIPKLPGGGPQVTLLAFEAVNWEATVSVGPDAEHLLEVGKHLSAWTPFQVDISKAVTPGQSALVRVAVRDRTFFMDEKGAFTVPAATEWNDRQARGIIRGVSLQIYPAVYIEDVFVKPNTASNTFLYTVTLVNTTDKAQKMRLDGAFSAWNPGAKWKYPALPSLTISLAPNERKRVTSSPITWTPGRASWWWPNVPYQPDYRAQLHNFTLKLYPNRDKPSRGVPLPTQTETVRFGFCTPGQKGNTYTLNGVRINLRGDSLPEGTIGTDAFARLPGFLPPTQTNPGWPGAVRNYQRLNFNVLRMHQVPCTRAMMDVCDELGMLVIPETAIRGGGGKKENITIHPDAFTTHLRELILRDRNHPSVFKWSLENELFGAPEAFLKTLYDTCMTADGTRPCSIDDGVPGLDVDYPSWPKFAVMEHYSQPPGTPDATGGKPRTDRPFGQGEYVWPLGATRSGPLRFALTTRALRFHNNADIHPYTLIDVWPAVIPGLTPANFPDPPLPPNSLEQGGRSLLHPAKPWQDEAIQLMQRSFAPVAVYDREFDFLNTASNGRGEWPAIMPVLRAGKPAARALVLFNDEFAGETLQVRVQPTLWERPSLVQKLPAFVRNVTVPRGGHVLLPWTLPVPKTPKNTALAVTLTVWKDGKERFRETIAFVIVPEGKAGTWARFEGQDEKTRGDWVGVYGKQAFAVPVKLGRSAFQIPTVQIHRGTQRIDKDPAFMTPLERRSEIQEQMINFERADSVPDPRIALRGPGLHERSPAAFLVESEPLFMRVNTDGEQPHRLSLYFVDYKREGRALDVDILDTQGHRLDTRRLANFGEGVYLNYRFTGSLIIRLTPLDKFDPTLSGLFVDAG